MVDITHYPAYWVPVTRAQSTEEPCAVKMASTVLETSGGGDPFAEFIRALKKAILHRKNALFYKTANGAERSAGAVGDMYMSLIHTAELNQENPFDYLVALLRNPRLVKDSPSSWLPWTYRETLANLSLST